MPFWLVSILSMFAKPVIQWALMMLERQYPGLAPVIEQILAWLKGQQGNPMAVTELAEHVDKMCSGRSCAPHTVDTH